MSLRSKFLSILSLSLGLAVFSGGAAAQEGTAVPAEKADKHARHGKMAGKQFGGRHGMRGGFGGFGLRALDLTDAQKAQIKSIRQANRPDATVLAELKTIREARKSGQQITPEQKARMQALRQDRAAKAKLVHDQILAILTPDQRTKLETQRIQMRERMKDRRERKGRPARQGADKPII